MAGLNRVILIGRLTKDPELRYTTTGIPQAAFTLAVDRDYTNQEGEREADFIHCIAWGKLAEIICNHLSKGRLIAVEGRIQVRNYEAKDGSKRWSTSVVVEGMKFLEPKGRDGEYRGPAYDEDGNELDEVPF